MESNEVRDIVEALLFASEVPVRIKTLSEVIGHGVKGSEIRALIQEMNADYAERGSSFSIEDIAGGVQLLTRSEFDGYVKKLVKTRQKSRLSRAALETLAIIAYRQPLTRPEMEAIRGVDCAGVSQTLLERGLVKIAGRSEAVGRPLLYATTQSFLEHFGLRSVAQLPKVDDLVAQMDKLTLATEMARELGGEPDEFAGEIESRLDPEPVAAEADGSAEVTVESDETTADTGDRPEASDDEEPPADTARPDESEEALVAALEPSLEPSLGPAS